MSYKVIPPDLEQCKSYDRFLKRLLVWEATTPAPKNTYGPIIAGALPNESLKYKKGLQDKFFEQFNAENLCKEGGLQLVRDFLKKELGENDLDKSVRRWDKFEDCRRGDKGIEEFILDFERSYNNLISAVSTAVIPAEIQAFMLLKRAGITSTQRTLGEDVGRSTVASLTTKMLLERTRKTTKEK